MRMSDREMEVALHCIYNRVNFINNGMMPGGISVPNVSLRDRFKFADNGWDVKFDKGIITLYERPQYKIKKRYGKRGKMLKPSLQYIGKTVTVATDWHRMNFAACEDDSILDMLKRAGISLEKVRSVSLNGSAISDFNETLGELNQYSDECYLIIKY